MTLQQEAILPSSDIENLNIVFPTVTQTQLAEQDIAEGVKHWRIWSMLAWQDIKLRYRRSMLGPFWLTISMAITAYTMGFLYAHIFHIELEKYFPFLVAGMLSWTLISTLVLEFTDGFILSDNYIKQIKLPYTLYMHRIAARNMIIFFHNIVVIIPVLLLYHTYAKIDLNTLILIPGLAILYINCISYGLIFAMIGGRYRDVSQIIKSLVQIVFFVTPVMWGPEVLGAKNQWVANINPFYAFLELIREPLLGRLPTLSNIVVASITTIIGLLISKKMFTKYRARIIYWL
jgi:ABC-type polysaccharide/polyol phosphate export permease